MGYVLKVEPREFAERWGEGYERKRRVKDDSSLVAQVP